MADIAGFDASPMPPPASSPFCRRLLFSCHYFSPPHFAILFTPHRVSVRSLRAARRERAWRRARWRTRRRERKERAAGLQAAQCDVAQSGRVRDAPRDAHMVCAEQVSAASALRARVGICCARRRRDSVRARSSRRASGECAAQRRERSAARGEARARHRAARVRGICAERRVKKSVRAFLLLDAIY